MQTRQFGTIIPFVFPLVLWKQYFTKFEYKCFPVNEYYFKYYLSFTFVTTLFHTINTKIWANFKLNSNIGLILGDAAYFEYKLYMTVGLQKLLALDLLISFGSYIL